MNKTILGDANTIRKLGISALTEKLGPIGMVEFMRQFDPGYGDYTKERHAWLDHLSIDDIVSEMEKPDTNR